MSMNWVIIDSGIGLLSNLVPSHYQNQYWENVNGTIENKLQWNLNQNMTIFIQENAPENVICELATILFQP